MMVQLGQGKIVSEIRQGLRESSLDRCWRNGEQRDDLFGNVPVVHGAQGASVAQVR